MKQALWKAYLTYSKRERQGIIVLLVLIGICAFAPVVWGHYRQETVFTDSSFLAEVLAFKAAPVVAEGKRSHFKVQKKIVPIDINLADSTAWESLRGIGPALAARIVQFREKLGGFYAVGQVGETFGLADSTFKKIQPFLRLHAFSLIKLDLNQADEKTLAAHPYIRYKLARLIVLYRSNNGPFRQPSDLLGIPLVDDSIYRKIEHYIKTENTPI